MPQHEVRECAAALCTRVVYTRDLCEAHYRRRLRTGDVGEDRPLGARVAQATCAVALCRDRAVERGWCHGHYQRWLRTGDVQAEVPLGRRRQAELCSVCGRPSQAKSLCATHYGRLKTTGDLRPDVPRATKAARGSGSVTRHGYRVVTVDAADLPLTDGAKRVMEHRLVMARLLGRALEVDENIHHVNGNRLDNRPENLELWSTRQPKGQRVEDKVRWAIDVLLRHQPDALSRDHGTAKVQRSPDRI